MFKFLILFIATVCISGCNVCDEEIIKSDFAKEELEYFYEIAFGSEFRNTNKNPRLLYWRTDVEVQLNGNFSDEDSLEIIRVIQELNQLIDPIEIKMVETGGNLNMHFDRITTFKSYSGYVPGNAGYFRIERIAFFPKAFILIDQQKRINIRKHLIREELTQVLGLKKDSWNYPESIFFQGWTDITEYSEIDRQLIRLMYNYNLPYGMKKSEFEHIFLKTKIDENV